MAEGGRARRAQLLLCVLIHLERPPPSATGNGWMAFPRTPLDYCFIAGTISVFDITNMDIAAALQETALEDDIQTFLPLTPTELQILLALADGERHGYAIMQEIHEQTGGRLRVGPGSLYGTVKRLLAAALIAETAERPDPGLND